MGRSQGWFGRVRRISLQLALFLFVSDKVILQYSTLQDDASIDPPPAFVHFNKYKSMIVEHNRSHTQSSTQWNVIFCTRWEAPFTTLVIGTRSLDRPAHSKSLCRLSYLGPLNDEHDLGVFEMFLSKISDQSGRKKKEIV